MSPEGRKPGRRMRGAHTTSRPAKSARRPSVAPGSHRVSAIVGGALIAVAALWFLWLLVRQVSPGVLSLRFPLPNPQPARPTSTPVDPLAVAGVTLLAPLQGQEPGLTQQQALLMAGQVEPQAAARATGVDARYTLFSYQASAAQSPGFHNVPTWLIRYRGIAEPRPDTAADPHATGASHDFYVFLDASTGRELLAIWL